MKKNILSLFLLIFCFVLNAQNAVNNVKPVSVEKAQENTVDAGIEFDLIEKY